MNMFTLNLPFFHLLSNIEYHIFVVFQLLYFIYWNTIFIIYFHLNPKTALFILHISPLKSILTRHIYNHIFLNINHISKIYMALNKLLIIIDE